MNYTIIMRVKSVKYNPFMKKFLIILLGDGYGTDINVSPDKFEEICENLDITNEFQDLSCIVGKYCKVTFVDNVAHNISHIMYERCCKI